jgi:hypothetical protein
MSKISWVPTLTRAFFADHVIHSELLRKPYWDVTMKDAFKKIRDYQDIRRKAALIRNWYLAKDGKWHHLTLSEAKKAFERGTVERKATVDEELDLDGI